MFKGNGSNGNGHGSGMALLNRMYEEVGAPPADGGADREVSAFVGAGVEFKGVIRYNGTVRIDGKVEGEIHTDGVLLVGKDAVIAAKISASSVVCRGKITGDIVATDKVKLLTPAALNGSVKAPLLSMEEGVLFNGTMEMTSAEAQPIKQFGRDSSVSHRSMSQMKAAAATN
jgi:cytoskeletal protein CcmA (bactofilin family)